MCIRPHLSLIFCCLSICPHLVRHFPLHFGSSFLANSIVFFLKSFGILVWAFLVALSISVGFLQYLLYSSNFLGFHFPPRFPIPFFQTFCRTFKGVFFVVLCHCISRCFSFLSESSYPVPIFKAFVALLLDHFTSPFIKMIVLPLVQLLIHFFLTCLQVFRDTFC